LVRLTNYTKAGESLVRAARSRVDKPDPLTPLSGRDRVPAYFGPADQLHKGGGELRSTALGGAAARPLRYLPLLSGHQPDPAAPGRTDRCVGRRSLSLSLPPSLPLLSLFSPPLSLPLPLPLFTLSLFPSCGTRASRWVRLTWRSLTLSLSLSLTRSISR